MKIIYLLTILACVQTAHGQDYCKLITKEVSDDKKTFEYASPFDQNDKPAVRVTRNYNTDPEYAYDNFYVIFRLESPLDSIYNTTPDGRQTERDERKLVVEFEDQSKITDDTIRINHDVSDDHTQAVRYIDFPLTDATAKDFATKKIARFSLAGNYRSVAPDSANSILHYIQCMKSVK